ncbi:CRISPR-associated protein Cpf1, subtype PREFRAN [Ruminococcus albus]|uniref:CRISPR-associated protein Cpf1, subtype PREFRAN n=1 Tax=Ruminococcus albus TaxID=1264 RepID=A0A1H7QEV0_RUMAL|nr:CRISPR-associated protein Cpf1, subtype PREFRAN [Ruminococcus albus]
MKEKKINRFTNRYTLSKTLQFQLLPICKTEENFEKKQLLEDDDKRSTDYKAVKKIIDDYHKHYINSRLAEIKNIDITDYADLYFKANKDLKDKKTMKQLEDGLRKIIADALTKDDCYAKIFKKELFSEILPEYFDEDQNKKQLISEFKNWVTYFQGFFENRNNLYTAEEKSTAIAYRCINDNLPKFLDNCRSYRMIKEALSQSDLDVLSHTLTSVLSLEGIISMIL